MNNNRQNTTNINWYPGHMVKAQKEIKESLKYIDVVVEILDARIPYSSKNPIIDELVKDKKRLIVLNKIDLADENKVSYWIKKYNDDGIVVVKTNANEGNSIEKIKSNILALAEESYIEKGKENKVKTPIYRALIVGIPNVGKSTIINKISKKTSAKVGNKPGVTLSKQWIRVGNNIEILDTPGILWPNLEDKKAGINLAITGNIKLEILDIEELAYECINKIKNEPKYYELLKQKYNLSEGNDTLNILEQIGKRRGCLMKGGEIDMLKTSNLLIEEFKSGKIGKISLE